MGKIESYLYVTDWGKKGHSPPKHGYENKIRYYVCRDLKAGKELVSSSSKNSNVIMSKIVDLQ